MISPLETRSPTETDGRRTMWQYRVTTWPACWTSTYQPQPRVDIEPSTSQLTALHSAVTTLPPAATRIGVLRAAAMSTPSWVGRDLVRKPLPTSPGTGTVQGRRLAGWP